MPEVPQPFPIPGYETEDLTYVQDPPEWPGLFYNHYFIDLYYPLYKDRRITIKDYVSLANLGVYYPDELSIDDVFMNNEYINTILQQGKIATRSRVLYYPAGGGGQSEGEMVIGVPKVDDPAKLPYTSFTVEVYEGGRLNLVSSPVHVEKKWWQKVSWGVLVFLGLDKLVGELSGLEPIDGLIRLVTELSNKLSAFIDYVNSAIAKPLNSLTQKITTIENNIAKNIQRPLNNLEKEVYGALKPLQESTRELVDSLHKSYVSLDNLFNNVRKIVEEPTIIYQETVLAPLNKTRASIDRKLTELGDFLAVFGLNEGKKARKYVDDRFDELGKWVEIPETELKRFMLNIEEKFYTFRNTIFKDYMDRAERVEDIIDATIELVEKDNPETSRIRMTPLQRTLEEYPATVARILESGREYDAPLSVTIPEPIDETLPEIADAENMIDKTMENLYLDDQEQPLNEAIGKDYIMTDNGANVRGEVKMIKDVLDSPNPKSFDDIACYFELQNRARDEGIILDTVWCITRDVVLPITAFKLIRNVILPCKYLLYPLETEYIFQASKWFVEGDSDWLDKLDDFNEDFWDSMVGWLQELPAPEPWLPQP